MANPFDQFDAPASSSGQTNPFDKFDDPNYKPKTQVGDLARKLKAGVQQLPGLVTGLADLAPAIATGTRPFTAAADYLGEVTGFQPGKWAKETQYSDANKVQAENVDEAWKGVDAVQKDPTKSKLDYAGKLLSDAPKIADAYLRNPMYTVGQVAESIPSMVTGGVGSKLLMGAGRMAGVAAVAADATTGAAATAAKSAVPGYLERMAGEKLSAPIAAGLGEGAVTAGQQMDQYTGTDQQKNALASLGAGTGTALIGMGAGRLANKMGLETAETAMAKIGTNAASEVPMSMPRRILGGMVSEAILQELPQSAQEQVWQNYADGKPLMEGVMRQGIEGALAGGIMGAAANIKGGANPAAAPAPVQAPVIPGDPQNPAGTPGLPYNPGAGTQTVFSDGSVVLNSDASNGPTNETNVTPPPAAPSFAGILDTDPVYSGWSNVQDGTDRAIMRDQMDYVARTYEGVTTADNVDMVRKDLAKRFKWFRAASPEQRSAALDLLIAPAAPVQPAPIKASEAMGLNPSAGPLSSAAVVAVDSGLTNSLNAAALQSQLDSQQAAQKPAPKIPVEPVLKGESDVSASTDLSNLPAAASGARPLEPGISLATGVGAGATAGSAVDAGGVLDKPAGDPVPLSAKRNGSLNVQNTPPASPAQAQAQAAEAPKAGALNEAGATAAGALAGNNAVEANGVAPVAKQNQPVSQAQPAPPAIDLIAKPVSGQKASQLPFEKEVGAVNIKAASTKLIPYMSDAELTALKDHYGPDHKRTPKLQKEIEKRAANRAVVQSIPAPKEPARDSAGNAIQRSKLEGSDRFQYPEPLSKNDDPRKTAAQARVVDYMNGDIDRPTLIKTLEDSGLDQGIIFSITQRLQDDGFSLGEMDALLARREQPAKPAPVNEVQDPVAQRAEAARADEVRKKRASRLRGYTDAKSPFLAFLGKHGAALSRKADFSPDKNPLLSGYGPLFRRTGKNTDLLLQNAIEENFLPEGADTQALEDLITQQISGMGVGQTKRIEAIYSPDVADRVMNERMDAAQQAYQDELAAQQEAAQNDDDPFAPLSKLEYNEDDAASSGYNDATQSVQLEVNALLLTAEKLGIDTEEITFQAYDETRSGTQQDYLEAARTALKSAIEGSNGDSRPNAGQPGAAASQEGLVAPSQADILAQQDRKTETWFDGVEERTATPYKGNDERGAGKYLVKGRKESSDGIDKLDRLMDKEQLDALIKSESQPRTLNLESPTPQSLQEREDRRISAIREEEKQQKTIDKKAKTDREAADIKIAGANAADRFVLGGNAEDELSGQGGMFDAPAPETTSAKQPSADAPAAKPDPLTEREKAAKAKMLGAAAKLATLLSKNTRLNITPEQEQAMLPIVIELFEGAMDLGYVKFKQAARYVREFLASAIDQDAADSIPMDTLQGAYIATSRRHKDKAITPKAEVITVESFEELNEPAPEDVTNPDASAGPTLSASLADAIRRGRMPKDNPALKKLVEEFDGKAPDPARMKQAQEQMELAIVMVSREVVAKGEGDVSTYEVLLRLYNSQPNLNIRTSTSIANQAYSTPSPLAFLSSRLAGITPKSVVHEPTGGTGMLLIGADPKLAIVNELNDLRVSLLKEQGFTPTQMDAATQTLAEPGQVDTVVTNPPFGSVKDAKDKPVKVKVDGYDIGQIDHLIAARALTTMKDDGRAVLILGANKVAGGLSTNDRIFFNWLYSHYNVVGHFEVDGDLYTRQGASWPVRVITINGRQKSNSFSPIAGTIERAQNWSEVYEQYKVILDASRQPIRIPGASLGGDGVSQAGSGGLSSTSGGQGAATRKPSTRGSKSGTGNVAGTSAGAVSNSAKPAPGAVGASADEQRLNAQPDGPRGLEPAGATDAGAIRNKPEKPAGAATLTSASAGNAFQAPYIPRSARKDEGVLIPTNMAQPTQDALSALEDEVGDIDEFARKELGYASVKDLHTALMGLQVDSVAMAIHQIKKDKAVVIADQTGIGKGRQAAAIIRWAAKSGFTPVFVSVKPSLFTDMYGDLTDIGTDDVRPFVMNGDAWIAGANGEKLFSNKLSTHRARLEAIEANGTLPDDKNAVFMTYSQINVDNVQRRALMALAPNAVFVLDESHNAAGASATSDFVIGALGLAKGVTYLSATYAKRPDNMPLYFKTDIGNAAADTDGLASAMSAGGLPLQTVVSNNLVKAGQMFRRERSYDGVQIASVFDTANKSAHEIMSDEATKALRAIVSADRAFHSGYVESLGKDLAAQGQSVKDTAGNQASAGVQHTEFSSVVHNFVKQMLLGLKAQSAADEAIASLKRGEKPIIAVENTMGSFLGEYAASNNIAQGDMLGSFDYRTVLSRALERTRVIVIKDAQGNERKEKVPLSQLDSKTRIAYEQSQAVINGLKLNIPVSPIDWMRSQIIKAGYQVAEITGRNLSVDYSDSKKPVLSAIDQLEQSDKVNTTRLFNSGKLDALILNVAGSTGISLHASEKFEDQRQRHMIVAQAAGDINIFMQMLGRIHRTGQVALPKYTILSVDLPTEKRPTAVLSVKMKSLNANTSSNTESATSVKTSDILNKYGDQIVQQYLNENYQLAIALDVQDLIGGDTIQDDLARKVTGRLALQPIEIQHSFYDEVEGQYNGLIDYLNKTNQNDLEPRTFDFDAKETRQEVLFEGPDKSTPFGEDAIYGEYSIKAQGIAMKPEEIREAMKTALDGKTPEAHINGAVATLLQTWIGQINENRRKNGLVPGAFDEDKYASFIAGLYGKDSAQSFVDAAKAQIARGSAVEDIGTEQIARSNDARIGIEFMRTHAIGKTFRVDINSEPYNAVVTNIRSTHKQTGNPFSLSKIQLTVSVNGALRSLSIPASQFRKIEVSSIAAGFQVEQLFKEQPLDQRETAKIVTGNLLAAYGEIDGARGTIISFTKQDGTTEQGILLPKLFDYSRNTRGDFRLSTGEMALRFLQQSENKDIGRFGIMSRDGNVRVLPSGQGIRVQVPKSKAKGGKFFLDKALIETGGDFVSSGGYMVSTVYDQQPAIKMLDLLMKKQALYALPSMADEAKAMVGDTPALSRSTDPIAASQSTQSVERIVQGLTSRWANAPEVVVVYDMTDPRIPAKVRARDMAQRSGGATGDPEGFFLNGKAYIVASQVSSQKDVARVLFHESLGHFGLRGVFGEQLKPILQQLAGLRQAEVAAKAKQYGLDMSIESDRLQAAEEVLAEMAQTRPEMGFVKRAIAIIRNWLRQNVPGFKNMALTDADIIANYILPARGFVERGAKAQMRGAVPAFSRDANNTAAGADKYRPAGAVVDGRSVRDDVPNMSSIASSLDDYTVLNGVREVPMSDFTLTGKSYSVSESKRIEALAARIKESGEINPLIVVIDREGSYILEGGHRSEALFRLGAKSFPAIVVLDNESLNESTAPDSGGAPMFSRSKAIADTIQAMTVTDIKTKAGYKLADLRSLGLQGLGGRQINELYAKDLPQLNSYTEMVQQMSADANEVGANADEIATTWGKLPDEKQLADLMHDATLAQIDPAKDFVQGDNRLQWGALNAKFKALTPAAKKVYTDARDGYEEHYSQIREAIRDKIERSDMAKPAKAAMLERMDGEFFEKIKGVYFPLARFGKYVVVTRKGADVVSVSRAETLSEAEQLRTSMRKQFPADQGYAVGKVLKDKEFNAARDSVGRGFLKDLFGVLDKEGIGDQLQDAVNQLYLASMPDLSWAKHGIHRKGTPGFSQDARRAYAQNMFHGARYLAKLRYADQLQDKLTDMQAHVEAQVNDEQYDSVKGQQVVDEMNKRNDSLMNPKSNPLSTALTSFGFVFHLGLSPASAMVNLSQTALVAYPIMGAKWGFDKAAAALAIAGKQAATNKNDISSALNADERKAYDAAVNAGTIDVTNAHDLAGIAQGEDQGIMWKMRPVMKWASFLFHHAERFNRQVTFVAAYRLAKDAKATSSEAFEQATKATYDGHFDYASSNRPRVMQGNTAKVLLLFKQFGQNMIYTLVRQAQLSIRAETPAGRKEARKALGGLLVMHAAGAGVLGLPLVTTLLAAASMLGGSDDEPWDAEAALRNMLADTFGQKPAEVMARGFSRLTPWDISGRVGLDKLILPDVQEGLEGQRLAESAMAAALGPVAGIGINLLKGMQEISLGRFASGFESMLPASIRGPAKALRYSQEGVKDRTGIVIKDEVSTAGIVGQAAGFSPSEVRNATEGRSAIYKADKQLMDRRKHLLDSYAQVYMKKDIEGAAEVKVEIAAFNEKNPNQRINGLQLAQSVRRRQQRIDQAEEGIYLPRKRRDAMAAGRFALED